MKTRQLLLIRHFLIALKNTSEQEKLLPISSSMKHLLSKKELHLIIQHMYDGEAETEYPHLNTMSKKSLLELINDEYYILSWLIEEIFGSYTL